MPYWRCYYHLVWATRDRAHTITADLEPRLCSFIVHQAAQVDVLIYAVNGMPDHRHVIAAIAPSQPVADVVTLLKHASTQDMGARGVGLEWQPGLGVITISEKNLGMAIEYVHRQKEHHRDKTTVAALERCTEYDDGTQAAGLPADWLPPVLRETRATYEVNDEPPF